MDWGYVLDRNQDGQVDYLAFLYGTACVAPEKREEPLPNVTGGTLTRELIEVITRNVRLVTRDTDFDRSFEECRYYAGLLRTDLGACEGTPAGYSMPGRHPGGLRQVPPRDESFLRMINRAVQECSLPAGSVRSLSAVSTAER